MLSQEKFYTMCRYFQKVSNDEHFLSLSLAGARPLMVSTARTLQRWPLFWTLPRESLTDSSQHREVRLGAAPLAQRHREGKLPTDLQPEWTCGIQIQATGL